MVIQLQAGVTPAGDAVDRLRSVAGARLRRYRQYQEFYEGRHFERARNGRSNLVLNYARVVVDKGIAYLLGRGVGFSVLPAHEASARERRRAEAAEQLLYDVGWQNDVEGVDLQVAQNAAVLGDGVYKVVWEPATERVRILSVDPRTFFATWAGDDPATLRRVEVAYSLAAEDLALGGYGLTASEAEGLCGSDGVAEVVERWTPAELQVTVGRTVTRQGPNPYGAIPFVHVPNLPLANESWGQSDLVDVIPINREIDERVSDQADVIRFHADPPIVFRGVTDHADLAVGPGTVWDIPSDADVKLLEWQGQAVAVGEHIERLYRTLYEVTETPRAAFGDSGRLLSGVALETELRPIVQRTLRKRAWWTRALRQRTRLVLRLARQFGVGRLGVSAPASVPVSGRLDGPQRGADDDRVRVLWPPMLPKDDVAEVQNQVRLVAAGLRSHRTAMDDLGTESPEEELARVQADRAALGERSDLSPRPSLRRGEGARGDAP
ncbi:MAG: phage portal protein [Chloroflexi bacterium]|nr:phage portal protein [Chloroflexota bacterium]